MGTQLKVQSPNKVAQASRLHIDSLLSLEKTRRWGKSRLEACAAVSFAFLA